MKPDIYRVEYIGSGSLSLMAKPESGPRIDDEFRGIRDFDIDRIVSLLEKQEAIDLGLGQEDLLAKKMIWSLCLFRFRIWDYQIL